MKSILASKLYKSSKYQKEILAAIENPINSELVTQIESYVDPEYLPHSSSQSEQSVGDTYTVDDGRSSEGGYTPHHHSEPHGSDIEDIDLQTPDDIDNSDEGQSDDAAPDDDNQLSDEELGIHFEEDDESDDELPDDASSSSNVQGQPITACTSVDVDEIRGTLSSREDTNGVNRILVKENELWVYYNDDVNLNNVMGSVIEVVATSGHSNLEFNRLARSDNAVVFEIIEKGSVS